MKKTLFFSFFLFSVFSFSQQKEKKDSIPATQIKLLNTNYKDFVIVNKSVYAITKGDSLISINLVNNKILFIQNKIKSISKSKKNKIVALTDTGEVLLQKDKSKFNLVDTFEGIPYKILIDKNNDFIIISSKYVRYKNENFVPEKDSPMYRKAGRVRPSSALIPIDVFYIDNENRIWLGYDAGEWGGDICFFDLNTKTFYTDKSLSSIFDDKHERLPKNDLELLNEYPGKVKVIDKDTLIKFPYQLYISNIKGVSQNRDGDFFISESLMHFSVSGGLTILKKTEFDDYYKNVSLDCILEKDSIINVKGNYKFLNEYIGTNTINKFNNSFYYYSDKGFFKIIRNNNKYSKDFIFKPLIYWTAGLPDAVGYQMSVIKFEFISEKEIVFLTSSNGIGYFDGKTVKYFK